MPCLSLVLWSHLRWCIYGKKMAQFSVAMKKHVIALKNTSSIATLCTVDSNQTWGWLNRKLNIALHRKGKHKSDDMRSCQKTWLNLLQVTTRCLEHGCNLFLSVKPNIYLFSVRDRRIRLTLSPLYYIIHSIHLYWAISWLAKSGEVARWLRGYGKVKVTVSVKC